jgi:hypothetical protein
MDSFLVCVVVVVVIIVVICEQESVRDGGGQDLYERCGEKRILETRDTQQSCVDMRACGRSMSSNLIDGNARLPPQRPIKEAELTSTLHKKNSFF